MLITKRRPKLKLENDFSKTVAIFFNNSIAMSTTDVPRDWFVFRMKAYWYIVKGAKFELSTVTVSAQQMEEPA